MPVSIGAAAALTAAELLFYGVSFFVLGMVLLGRGALRDAGPIFLTTGGVNGILALVLLTLSISGAIPFGGVGIVISLALLVFATTFVSLGMVAVRGYDAAPLGSLGIFYGITMIPFAVFLSQNPLGFGQYWLTMNVILWFWAFFTLPLAFLFKKISMKVAAWTFLVEAFVTLWLPAVIILVGAVASPPFSLP
jgi:AmiS/UreI family transporter